ncbi:MAG: alpha-galactosidase [Clostridia bacterium]|nr:alpha-galactosidase [Clostridia bacterium]
MSGLFHLTYTSGGETRSVDGADVSSDDLILSVSDDGSRRTITVRAKKEIGLLEFRESCPRCFTGNGGNLAGTVHFMNGYQSWTDSRETYLSEKEKDVKALPRKLVDAYSFDKYGDASFYQYRKNILHGFDVYYCKGERNGFILNLNFRNAYLVIEVDRGSGNVTVSSDVFGAVLREGDEFTVCDYAYAGSFEKGLSRLRQLFSVNKAVKLFGYTSWYNYYQDINETIILRDLEALDERFGLFQIDDGYEKHVGDWMTVDKQKFPNGLMPIVESIHLKGMKAGIWLAPFVAEENSELFQSHKDWFRKDDMDRPVKCGSNWGGFYALDLENGQVLDYIDKCLAHYSDLGFDFFKLDFLYASNLPEYYGITRSQAAERAYSRIRNVLKDKLILGCGATLFNCIGKFDYVRVGPDVSLKFDDAWYMRFMHRERISTKVTLQNTVYRSFFDGKLFGNDPDVFLLRDENNHLTPGQRKSLLTLNALFGSVMMTSDNISVYDDEKLVLLSEALDLFENASVTGYRRDGRFIVITYSHKEMEKTIRYDTVRGELID